MKWITEVLEKLLIFLPFSLHYAEQFRVLCSKNTQIASAPSYRSPTPMKNYDQTIRPRSRLYIQFQGERMFPLKCFVFMDSFPSRLQFYFLEKSEWERNSHLSTHRMSQELLISSNNQGFLKIVLDFSKFYVLIILLCWLCFLFLLFSSF